MISAVLAGGVAAISFSAVLIRLAEADPAVIAFYRLFFASLLLAPWAGKDWKKIRLSHRQLALMVGAGVFLALHFLLWMTSLEHTSVASSVVLVTTQPLFVFLFSIVFLREVPPRSMWGGLLLALAGSVLVVFGQGAAGQSRLLGNLLALGGAVMMALYFLAGRKVRGDVPLALYSALVYGFSSAALALFILWQGLPWGGYNAQTWRLFFLLALLPTILGHNSLNWALKYLPATMVSVVILGEPIGAALLAGLILKEIPAWIEIFGGGLILAGIFLVWRNDPKTGQAGSAENLQEQQAGGAEKTYSYALPPAGAEGKAENQAENPGIGRPAEESRQKA